MTIDVFSGLSDQQCDAVRTLRGPVKIIAGAGSGKTLTITRRIVNGIISNEYDPGHVMALSFTRRASMQLRSRLIEHGVKGVYSGTFHSAALSQLRFFWETFHGKPPRQIIRDKVNLLRDAARGINFSFSDESLCQVASEIEWAKQNGYDLSGYDKCNHRISGMSASQARTLMLAYEDVKNNRRLIDFEDILSLTVGMLSVQPRAVARVRDRFRVFLIDEFQDVSPLQFELLRIWLGRRRDICVVGDPNQCIYSFAGAKRDYLVKFADYFPGAREVFLSRNYRSRPEIVCLSRHIINSHSPDIGLYQPNEGISRNYADIKTATPVQDMRVNARNRTKCHCTAPPGTKGAVRCGNSDLGYRETPIRWHTFENQIQEMHFIAQSLKNISQSCAVLYRTAIQGERLAKYLHTSGIIYRSQESRLFHETDVAQIACKRVIEKTIECNVRVVDLVDSVVSGIFPRKPDALTGEYDGWVALQALRLCARRFNGNASSFATYLLEMQRHRREPEMPFATLATLHSTKGLEWDTVYIIGVNEGLIPHHTGDEDEEKRLFYVGVTRARKNIVFSSTRTPSRYLTELCLSPISAKE